ncbi:MAG: glycosyltransferase family 2 protein [Bacilli bacterium]|nr:glycosyltransferase family 2 protein [Bacilli bacterium]
MQVLLIINYNDYKNTKRLIENVADFKTINHVVVVDNCSTDDSYDKLLKLKVKADIVKSEANKGYSYAINYGMKYIEKKYKQANVFISNSDIIIPTEDSLILMLKELKGNVGLVGPVVNEHGVLNRGWKMPTPMVDAFLNLVVVHNWVRKKKIFYKEDHYNDKVSRVDVVSGCFFLVNTKDFKNINYLDENVFLYYEENILASKLKSIGKNEIIVNDAFIIHDHAATIDNNIKRIKKFKILKKSQYYFQTKYNHANWFEKFMLKLNKNISLVCYYIAGIFKGGK